MLSRWATEDLAPDLTVLLDLPPEIGLARARGRAVADRLESESLDFHQRVRQTFRALAEADPDRYLVVDARQSPDQIAAIIRVRVAELLAGLPLQQLAQAQPAPTPALDHGHPPRVPGPHHPHTQTGTTPQLHP
jgi:dTMP kinase